MPFRGERGPERGVTGWPVGKRVGRRRDRRFFYHFFDHVFVCFLLILGVLLAPIFELLGIIFRYFSRTRFYIDFLMICLMILDGILGAFFMFFS